MTATETVLTTTTVARRPARLWAALLIVARIVVALVCRFRITGELPRRGPVLLAGNHIGLFDPIALAAACHRHGVAPSFLATAGLFRAPVVGAVLRQCRHIPVDRRAGGGEALEHARSALDAGAVIAAYPEGRISLDPGLWPERAKTGIARLALTTGVPVIPVAQWGAHEVLAWEGARAMLGTLARALVRRPVVAVHFGPAVDLSDLSPHVRGDALRAADRITEATVAALRPLRRNEPDLPRFVDVTRPVTTERTYRPR